MIHLTGVPRLGEALPLHGAVPEKDRILTPYIFQYRALIRQRGKLDPEIFMDMIDAWLDTWLKVVEDFNKTHTY
jgi:hypothetical protein